MRTLLPTHDVFDEDRYFEPTVSSPLLRFGGKNISLTICDDVKIAQH